jgi:hypothetical protein
LVTPFASQVADDIRAVSAKVERIRKSCFAQGPFQDDGVVLIIFSDQNRELLVHGALD